MGKFTENERKKKAFFLLPILLDLFFFFLFWWGHMLMFFFFTFHFLLFIGFSTINRALIGRGYRNKFFADVSSHRCYCCYCCRCCYCCSFLVAVVVVAVIIFFLVSMSEYQKKKKIVDGKGAGRIIMMGKIKAETKEKFWFHSHKQIVELLLLFVPLDNRYF